MADTPAVADTPAEPTQTTTAAPAEPAATPAAPALVAPAEPQSALTEKFTDAEWTALKELRVRSTFHTLHVHAAYTRDCVDVGDSACGVEGSICPRR